MDHREKKRLLDAAEWGKIYPRLLAFATGRARSDDMGKDLAQNAIANVYDVDSTWDPEKQPDLLRHLMSLVNSDLWARRTSAASKLNRSIETSKQTRKLARAVEDKSAFSERRAEEHDLLTRRVQLLRERLVKDGDVLTLLSLMEEDAVDTPAAIKERTGWNEKKVAAVRLRLMRAAAKVAQDLGGDYEEALDRAGAEGAATEEEEEAE